MKDILNSRFFLLFILGTVLLLPLLKICHTIIVTNRTDIVNNDKENYYTDLKYKVFITNKSKSPIYFRSVPNITSSRIYDNEKIHFITKPIDQTKTMPADGYEIYPFIVYYSIETKIDSIETRVFRVRGDEGKILFLDNEEVTKRQDPEIVTDVHYLLFFTRNPYKLQTYTEYVEVMKNDGYAVLGYRNEDEFYFFITDTEMKVNDYAVNDLLFFVHSIRDNTKNQRLFDLFEIKMNRFIRKLKIAQQCLTPESSGVPITRYKLPIVSLGVIYDGQCGSVTKTDAYSVLQVKLGPQPQEIQQTGWRHSG